MARRRSHLKIVKEQPSLAKIIEGMPLNFMWCRDIGHMWDAYTVDRPHGKVRVFVEAIICKRCGSFKIRQISARGILVNSRYKYAEGYLIPSYAKASTADARAKIRLALAQRLVEENVGSA